MSKKTAIILSVTEELRETIREAAVKENTTTTNFIWKSVAAQHPELAAMLLNDRLERKTKD